MYVSCCADALHLNSRGGSLRERNCLLLSALPFHCVGVPLMSHMLTFFSY